MNMFEIGDSMPLEADLQRIGEVEEPDRTTQIKKLNEIIHDDNNFDQSVGTNNNGKFTQ